MRLTGKTVVALAFVVLIFVPRLLNLADFINIDACLHWVWRSAHFWDHLLAYSYYETKLTDHPGVTIMLGTGGSMRLASLVKFGTAYTWDHFGELLFYAKLPIALITGLGLTFVYWILARCRGDKVFAVLALFFLAIDPYFLAHSRYLHLDAVNATFMLCCLLTAATYLLGGRMRWLWLSGGLLGLGLLTRSSSFALVPYVLSTFFLARWRDGWAGFRVVLRDSVIWLAMGAIVFTAIWPVMWVAPLQTVTSLINAVGGAAVEPHQATGQDAAAAARRSLINTGLYEDLIARRAATVVLFAIPGTALLLYRLRRQGDKDLEWILAYLAVFAVILLVGISFFAKASSRYAFVSFLVLQLLGAYGLYVSSKTLLARYGTRSARYATVLFVLGICLWNGYEVLRLHPYYDSFHSGLRAPRQFGWGEGLELVAAHLNAKENSQKLVVSSFYPCVLGYHFDGETRELDAAEEGEAGIDYVVLYDSQVKRHLYPNVIREYHSDTAAEPDFVAVINGVEYAWLYPVK